MLASQYDDLETLLFRFASMQVISLGCLAQSKGSSFTDAGCQSPQRPSIIEAQPVFNERGMRGFEPACQYLRVDCPQVFARTSAQGAGEADQIVRRSWHAARPRCRRSVGILWGRRPLDNLEFRFLRSAAGKPASDRTHLTVFQCLPAILFGGLTLCQACAARCRQGW
jgi:hypothetical protein